MSDDTDRELAGVFAAWMRASGITLWVADCDGCGLHWTGAGDAPPRCPACGASMR